jgi:NADH:ubiquinone oxidoreductase subunit 6 (subunit J)
MTRIPRRKRIYFSQKLGKEAEVTVIEKNWKRLSWVFAVFTFAMSAATFVKNFPVLELALCVVLAAAVFVLVRLGFHTVKGFYERPSRNQG